MFVICPGQGVQGPDVSGAARVTYEPYLPRSARIAAGEMPEMIVSFKLTCHQSTAKEALFIGSNTTAGGVLVEISGLRGGFSPIVVGEWVTQSFVFFVIFQHA